MKKRVADIIMETLVSRGVTNCFGVVGGGAMYLDNALALNDDIHKVFNHHEQASAMAAEGYARYCGKPALVCVTSGPGSTNAITGVMGCWQDSLPMIVVSGQVRYAISVPQSGLELRYRGIQEFDIIGSVKNMTKYAVMLTDPLSVRREINKAYDIAMSGRRGPVWLDVPQDIQSAVVEEDDLYPDVAVPAAPCACESEAISVLEELKNAKRPVILAGTGVVTSGCMQEFRSFVKKLRIPVIGACIAADAMYSDYDRFYGMSGSIGPRTGNFIVQNADVILSVACSLGFKMSGFAQDQFAPHARIISVDVDANEMKKPGVRVDKFIQSDLKGFLHVMEPVAQEIPVEKDWIAYCDRLKARFSPFDPAESALPEERVCAYSFWKEAEKLEPDDAIYAMGTGTPNSVKLQVGVCKPKQRVLTNNNCGAMGGDLPVAIGAAIASGKTVICTAGDGSIMLNFQEFQTIKKCNLPIKVIIFTNDGYNAIRQTSNNFFDGVSIGCSDATGLSFPDFEKVAGLFGFSYRKCATNAQLEEMLAWLYSTPGQVLLEVLERFDDPVTPKVMSRLTDDGTYATPALQDMYPFIEKEEYNSFMLWK